jgi:hypothetical protein
MAVRTEKSEVVTTVVERIAIDVIDLQPEFDAQPRAVAATGLADVGDA